MAELVFGDLVGCPTCHALCGSVCVWGGGGGELLLELQAPVSYSYTHRGLPGGPRATLGLSSVTSHFRGFSSSRSGMRDTSLRTGETRCRRNKDSTAVVEDFICVVVFVQHTLYVVLFGLKIKIN